MCKSDNMCNTKMYSVKNDINEKVEQEKKLMQFLLSLGGAGEIADKVSDLILFHNKVRENAEKRYM